MTTSRVPRTPHRPIGSLQSLGGSADSITATPASRAYRDLVHALADSVVEYHAKRHGVEMISHVNASLLQRVQRQRAVRAAAMPTRR